ncbi:MAG: FtsX-like permease family protein [Candidatus Latescibacteria bacterium]|nr:FtsX-like permease family protein [Candidatus Latescibacterota bacterium]
MLGNYLIIAVRRLLQAKGHALVNGLGLALGLAACLVVQVLLEYDLSVGKDYAHSERIYRLLRETADEDQRRSISRRSVGALGPALQEGFPQVEEAVRIFRDRAWVVGGVETQGGTIAIADPALLSVFDFPLVAGDPARLGEPYTVLVRQGAAARLFGGAPALGQTITLGHKWFEADFTVAGILADMPANALGDLTFDFLTATRPPAPELDAAWNGGSGAAPHQVQSYLLLDSAAAAEVLADPVNTLVLERFGAAYARDNRYLLQSLTRIWLYSERDYGLAGYGDVALIVTLGAAALFILAIACINFANLSTARSALRSVEVGVRKVAGASARQLALQFLVEALLLSLLGLALALLLVETGMPWLSTFFERPLELGAGSSLRSLGFSLCIAAAVGAVAGAYPALVLARMSPRGLVQAAGRSGGGYVRHSLVVCQFLLSVLLVLVTAIVHRQVEYVAQRDLGLRTNDLVVLPIFQVDATLKDQPQALRAAFADHAGVRAVTTAEVSPGWGAFTPRQAVQVAGRDEPMRMFTLPIDTGFLEVFGIGLLAGADYASGAPRSGFLLNETAARLLGDGALGTGLGFADGVHSGPVVGVVADFHHEGLREEIGPMVLYYQELCSDNLTVRIDGADEAAVLAFLEKNWRRLLPNRPFEFDFFAAQLDRVYSQARTLVRASVFIAALAAAIACLGLLGLAAHAAQRRRREICIRVVLGAPRHRLLLLLAREFALLVGLANVLAWPLAWLFGDNWLQQFAYSVQMGQGLFAAVLTGSLVLALGTVAYHFLQATAARPADVLRSQ